MRKKITLTSGLLFFSFCVYSQVGVNTQSPKATLDVVGDPTNASKLDGIIPPRITGEQLRAKTYTGSEYGAIVCVTVPDPAPAGQTIEVKRAGYYYFNGGVWLPIFSGGFMGVFTAEVLNNASYTISNNVFFNPYDSAIYELTFQVRRGCTGNSPVLSGKILIRGVGGRMTVLKDYITTSLALDDSQFSVSNYTITGDNTNTLSITSDPSLGNEITITFNLDTSTHVLSAKSSVYCAQWKGTFDLKRILN
ncbi:MULTISPECIES: hypothetical protein [unclassified Chryseobacterium]|uniref:hypothetical protein n=1 Tax=unclassified Chryseobacterium TaxID=2593645 RepID=UPI000956B94B|nr:MULTISPECIES: hypothetical protein [unclassified Chryseobacterium]SIR55988.1 hypothetical protein SAMN05880573_12718 [Chryseobacterium sp. RU33C]